jgi:type I restriction enzyme, S subunit
VSELSAEAMQGYPFADITLPLNWSLVTLEQISADVSPGFASGRHNSNGAGVPHLRPMNVDRDGQIDLNVIKSVAQNNGIELRAGDVLFNNTNSAELVGKTAAVSDREAGFAFSNHMTRVRLESGMSPVFAARQLHFLWMTGYMRQRCTNHVNQASISSKTLANTIPFLVPPTAEQTRIEAKLEALLSDLDAGVAELKAAQKKLMQYRQSLLKAAVEGTLTAKWRALNSPAETGAQLLQRILAERRARWEAKQLAKFQEQRKPPPKDWQKKYPEPVQPDTKCLPGLPEGWVWASLGQLLAELTSGSRDWAPYYDRGYCVFVMAQNVRPWRPDFSFKQYVDPPIDHRDRARSEIQTDDLLTTIVGANTGQVCRVANPVTSHFVCQSVALMRLVLPGMAEYVNAALNSEGHGQRQFREMNYGAGRPHLSFEQLESVLLPLPPLAEQVQVINALSDSFRSCERAEAELSAVLKPSSAQRQNILRAAFSGQLVPQNPNDEPASVLLARIRAERETRAPTINRRKGAARPSREAAC